MNFSEAVSLELKDLGYTHCFFVPGGGSMHLLNAFRNEFFCIPVVHEVAAGLAAESFNEMSENKKAFALVTSGPGFTNIATAIAQAYVEFRPLLVIGGQVKSSDLSSNGLRQRGVQEIDGKVLASSITCKSVTLDKPIEMTKFRSYVQLTESPSPGPVFIEICLDVQAKDALKTIESSTNNKLMGVVTKSHDVDYKSIVSSINQAKRPLLILGNNLSRSVVIKNLERLKSLNVPVLTTTSSIDRVPTEFDYNYGFGGTWGGNYHSNIILSQCDLIIAVGAKLDLQSTGYNIDEFIGDKNIIHVFPHEPELSKGHFKNISQICQNPDFFFENLLLELNHFKFSNLEWIDYCNLVRDSIPRLMVSESNGFVNPQKLIAKISEIAEPNSILSFCSSGAASFTHALQAANLKLSQKLNVSPSFASMGVGLAAAIGCAVSNPMNPVYHFEGDGGFAQNLQEIGTVKKLELPIKIFIFDNGGFASIRNTQKKYFDGTYLGCDDATGLGLPDWTKLFSAYDITAIEVSNLEYFDSPGVKLDLLSSRPQAWIIKIDPNLEYLPAVTTRIEADGNMISEPLSKMLPTLGAELREKIFKYKK